MRYTALFEADADEAIGNLREAMSVYVESLQAHGEPLPVEDLLIKPLDVAVA